MATRRLLDFGGKEFLAVMPLDLKQSILASEGRTVLAEALAGPYTYLPNLTNAELERAAGADLILFNALDLFNPVFTGVPDYVGADEQVSWMREAVARPLGVNIEPVDVNADMAEPRFDIPAGRMASAETFEAAQRLGFSFICLTGNPGTGVTNDAIKSSVALAREHFDGLIIAGKMHGAGVDEPVMTKDVARDFIDAGIDILMTPAPYTVPGFMEEDLREIVAMVKDFNKGKTIEQKVLVMTANGTSQDSCDVSTIRSIALASKACGADLQHIGDSFNGVALPENIFAMGEAIRGRRHQLNMLARSNIRGGYHGYF